jgi:hypothetical protein
LFRGETGGISGSGGGGEVVFRHWRGGNGFEDRGKGERGAKKCENGIAQRGGWIVDAEAATAAGAAGAGGGVGGGREEEEEETAAAVGLLKVKLRKYTADTWYNTIPSFGFTNPSISATPRTDASLRCLHTM